MAKFRMAIAGAAAVVILALSPRLASGADPTLLLLEVVINGLSTEKVGEFVRRDGDLLARPGELYDLGLRLPEGTPAEPDNLVSLSRISGLTWKLDEATQTLYVSAGFRLLLPTLLQARAGLESNIPVESGTGLTLNYDVVGTRTSGSNVGSGAFDLRAFSPWGVVSSGLLSYLGPPTSASASPYSVVRLDTKYAYSDPDELRRYSAGDFINDGLVWTRPVRLGGAQIKSDFSLRPDLVTMPLPLVSGTVAVPSTVDVLINGDRVFSGQVQPGPFQVPQLPVVSGASTISLAVSNALGRQVVETLPFYSGGGLLAPDLQSFAAEAGAVRRNFGVVSNDYGNLAASASWRRGFTNDFTAEAHGEGTSRLAMGGIGGSVNVADYAVANFGAAGSSNSGQTGGQIALGISRVAEPWSFGASAIVASKRFADIAAANGDPVPSLQLNGSVGLSLAEFGSLGVAYTGIDRPNSPFQTAPPSASPKGGPIFLQPAQHAHIFSASYSVQIRDASAYVTGFHDLTNNAGSGVLVGITIPLGSRGSASAGGGGGSSGGFGQFQANQPAVAVGDWGYQVYGATGSQSRQFGQVQYMSPWALVSAGADHGGGQSTLRLEGQGALSLVAGGLFASNTINDSFAIVDTGGVPNVRVLSEHREVGRTNDSGQVFVPDLRAFDVNHLEIDPTDVPVDAAFATTARSVRPQDRSGIVVEFPIKVSRGALLRLVDAAGAPIPLGSTATLKATGAVIPVGYDGEAYAEDLEPHDELLVVKPDGKRCTVAFEYRPIAGDIPTIGPLACREEGQ